MSGLTSYAYPGLGQWAQTNLSYTQAIRVGKSIICSGQGGWKTEQTDFSQGIDISKDLKEEIGQAFSNCDYNLKTAGGTGWSQVYRVVTYSTDLPSQHKFIIENLRRWMPDHYAVWTELGVKELGDASMHFEIDVEAYDEEGAAEAQKLKTT